MADGSSVLHGGRDRRLRSSRDFHLPPAARSQQTYPLCDCNVREHSADIRDDVGVACSGGATDDVGCASGNGVHARAQLRARPMGDCRTKP